MSAKALREVDLQPAVPTKLHFGRTEDLVARYVAAARSENTREAYGADLRDFERWGASIPTTAEKVARYLAERAQVLQSSTLRRRLASLAAAHHDLEAPDPTKHPLVVRVMRGIERTHGSRVRQASPLVISDLDRVIRAMDYSVRGQRDRAILLLGFFGGLRRSEITGLELADLVFCELGVCVTIRKSKTDQTARGRTVVVPPRPDALCTVRALEAWIGVRKNLGGKLFYRLDREGMATLHPGTVGGIVKARVGAIGLPAAAYSSHSLRAGLVTSALLARTDGALIARQTGHRSQQSLSIYARPAAGLALPAVPHRPQGDWKPGHGMSAPDSHRDTVASPTLR